MTQRFAHSILAFVATITTQNVLAKTPGQTPGQTTADTASSIIITAAPPSNSDNELFEKIIRKDQERRQQSLEIQILGIDEDLRQQHASENTNLLAREKGYREKAEAVLKRLKTPETPPFVAAEARFKLATLQRTQSSQIALEMLREALEILNSQSNGQSNTSLEEQSILLSNIQISIGEICLEKGDLSKAQRSFEQAVRLSQTDTQTTSSEMQLIHLRALIHLGDVHFLRFHFEKADASYAPAEYLIRKSDFVLGKALETLQGPLLVRRLWANFRSGRYARAAEITQEFARQRPTFTKELAPDVMEDVIRSAGIALAETGNFTFIESIAKDSIGGDFSKDVIVATLRTFARSGRLAEAEQLAKRVDATFVRSGRLVDFLEVRWECAKLSHKEILALEIATLISERMAYSSSWSKNNLIDSEREIKRSNLVAEASEEVGEQYFREGRRTSSRLAFQKAFSFFEIRLQEFVDGTEQGPLRLRTGQVALLAGKQNEAEKYTRASLAFPLTEIERKSAYHQLVEIAGQRIQTQPSETQFIAYRDAVDAFARAFPEDPAARLAMFECARKQEALGKISDARQRLERLLAHAQSVTPFDESEKERITLALLALNARDSDTARATTALGDLERQVLPNEFPKRVLTKVQAANAASIQNHATKLNEQGKLIEAAEAQLLWAQEYGDNPETPFVLLAATQAFFELGELQKTKEAAALIITNFPNHIVRSQALYWQGRTLESDLAFLPAANAFVASAFDNKSHLLRQERIDALTRAQTIFKDLDDKETNARLLEKIAAIQRRNQPAREVAEQTLIVATAYRDAGRYPEAERMFLKILSNDALPKRTLWEAELKLLDTRVRSEKNLEKTRRKIEGFVSHLALLKGKKDANARSEFLANGVLLALNTDLTRIESTTSQWASPVNRSGLNFISNVAYDSKVTFAKIHSRSSSAPEKYQEASILLGKIREKVAEQFSNAAAFQARQSTAQADVFARKAETFRIEARQVLFGGLSTDISKRSRTSIALATLGSSTNLEIEPHLLMQEPTMNVSSEVVRTVLESKNLGENQK